MNWLTEISPWLPLLLAAGAALAAVLLAGVALARDPLSPAHRSFALGLVVLAIATFSAGMASRLPVSEHEAMLFWERMRLVATALVPAVWLRFSLIYSRGNYREFLRSWRWALWLVAGLPLATVVLGWKGLVHLEQITIPRDEIIPTLGAPGYVVQLVVLLGSVAILLNLERTFRASVGTQRWRIKLVVLGLALYFVVRLYVSVEILLTRRLIPALDILESVALLLACALVGFSLIRTRGLDVPLYPSHAVLRNSLTLILAGLYLLIVGVLAKLVTWIGGDVAFPVKAIVVLAGLVFLGLVLMSDRLRLGVGRFVTRHLRRPSHDYRAVWQTFTERISAQVTAEGLSRTAAEWLSQTFNVLSASVWLTDPEQQRFELAASTLTEHQTETASTLALSRAELTALTASFRHLQVPLNMDVRTESWAQKLRAVNPGRFAEKGGHRYALPLTAGDQCLGVVVLSDRIGGEPYTQEDLDLLKCIGDQLGHALLTLRLAERLVQAREMEAFQSMSTFFVHDLKNTATTLSLMLQNLPRHYQNAEYREDALRSLGKCVGRINDLVSELSLLRRGLELKLEPANLAKVVETALLPIAAGAGSRLRQDLSPLPAVRLDVSQVQKVVTNLVLNALDAVGTNGFVNVTTFWRDGWVGFCVEDNGVGMNTEFIRHSLFRPFQTTKKKGIGIGLFHCKTIVEAHAGRIEVESRVGAGSTFRVLFPPANLVDEQQTVPATVPSLGDQSG